MTSDDYTDTAAVFQKLTALPENKVCFECNAENPTWAEIWCGVFICDDCAEILKNYDFSICFVRSIFLSSWIPEQLCMMSIGGNERARVFFEQHGWPKGGDLKAKYSSEAAKSYDDLLMTDILSAMKNVKSVPLASLSIYASNEFLDVNVTEDLKECNPERDENPAICVFDKASPQTVSTYSVETLIGSKVTRRTAGLRARKLISQNQDTDVARRKFPNAKSISSAQFFEDQENMDHENMDKLPLLKFSTSTANSSADLFGCRVKNTSNHSIQDWIKSIFG